MLKFIRFSVKLVKFQMSIFLLVGQCGIQLGDSLLKDIYSEMEANKYEQNSRFFDFFHIDSSGEIFANALLIDMEPKVVENSLSSQKKTGFKYKETFVFTKQEGSGNNWAFGFNIHGPSCRKAILSIFSKLSDKISNLTNVILVQSIAGGTGSGLGSFFLSDLSNEFSDLFFINFLVVPKLSGEVILQYYNAIFSLSSIYENSDAIFILENDKADLICKTVLKMSSVNLDSMNHVLSKLIGSTLLLEKENGGNFFDAIEENVIPLPHLKLLGSRFLPLLTDQLKDFSTDTWKGLLARAQQMIMCGSTEGNINWHTKIPVPRENFSNLDKRESQKIGEQAKMKGIPFFQENITKSLGVYMEINSPKNDFEQNDGLSIFQDSSLFHRDLEKQNFEFWCSSIKRKDSAF